MNDINNVHRQKTAYIYFDAKLMELQNKYKGENNVLCSFKGNQSVKHLIESLGIPHAEVSKILVYGKEIDFSYIVRDLDQIEVFGYLHPVSMDKEPRFVLDIHLGKLARYMRMLGVDALYQNDFKDDVLAFLANGTDARILLTRDKGLLMRKQVTKGYWVRAKDPKKQLLEIVCNFRLQDYLSPFQRCLVCNTKLLSVPKKEVLHLLAPLTKKYFNDFKICPACRKIYWRGSHYDRMVDFLNQEFGIKTST